MEKKKRGRPAGTGDKHKERGAYATRFKGQESIQERHAKYMRGLSTVVGNACDEYFRRKGMPTSLSWAEQIKQKKQK